MSKYLVTGGAGFIGSHVCDFLASDMSNEVHIVDNLDPYYDPAIKIENIAVLTTKVNVRFIRADIRNFDEIGRIIHGGAYDYVIHLAAQAGVRNSITDPRKYFDVNLYGTLNVLEAVKMANIKKMIFASSSSVYGMNKKIPFSESDAICTPASPYAASKIAGENLCHSYSHLYGIPIICYRFFTVYGPRQRPDMAINKFVEAALSDREIVIYGVGTSQRDYTYVSDIVNGIIKGLDHECDYEIFNLGNSYAIELMELVQIIGKCIGQVVRIKYLPDQAGDVPVTYADISKSHSLIEYHPRVSIEQGIKHYVDWYQSVLKNKTIERSTIYANIG